MSTVAIPLAICEQSASVGEGMDKMGVGEDGLFEGVGEACHANGKALMAITRSEWAVAERMNTVILATRSINYYFVLSG